MSRQDVFEQYLDNRYQEAGALTPSQKLAVVEELENEARIQGKVPTGEDSRMSLPTDHEAFQAVLRGENVSLGATTVSGKQDWMERLQTLPLAARIGIVAGIFVLVMLMASLAGRSSASAEEPTPTIEPTMTASPTAEPTATAVPIQPTPVPPTEAPPPTPTPQLLFGGSGIAGEESRDPASIEIGGRLFIVGKGEVKDGLWQLSGQAEWLSGTEVRRVFAIPYEQMEGVDVQSGNEIYVRTRGGQVITYIVRDVIELQANQIETLYSLRPSVVIGLPMSDSGDARQVQRIVIFGEAKDDDDMGSSSTTTSAQGGATGSVSTYYVRAANANLRKAPGLHGAVVQLMPIGTPLELQTTSPTVSLDNYTWLYVSSPYGYGWVASELVSR